MCVWCSAARSLKPPSEVWMTRFPWSGGRQSHIRLWWMGWGCFQWWICRTGPELTVTQWAAKNGAAETSSVVTLEIVSSCFHKKFEVLVCVHMITHRDDTADFGGKISPRPHYSEYINLFLAYLKQQSVLLCTINGLGCILFNILNKGSPEVQSLVNTERRAER